MTKTTRILVTVFGGWFGLHKYIDGKIGLGFIYTVTGGLFGIGWFIDCIKALFLPAMPSKNLNPVIKGETFQTPYTEPSVQFYENHEDNSLLPEWHVSVSFGKSSSENYQKAVALARMAPQYHEQTDNGKILHQAIYSSRPKEYLAFIMLYELVSNWKSTFVIINGQLIDRRIIGQLNYCYGDRCRSGNPRFCYGASYMTENPFGCHRLQISACNHPWWSFYVKRGNSWELNRSAMLERINSYASVYALCPVFDYESIICQMNKLPIKLTAPQYQELIKQSQNSINLQI